MPAKKKPEAPKTEAKPAAKPAAKATVKAAPAPAKPAAAPAPTPAPVPKSPAKPKADVAAAKPAKTLNPEQRYRWIQDAAYFLAEKDGFKGDTAAYWVQAEKAFSAEFG